MLSTNATSISPANDSCWTKIQNCLCNKKTVQGVKASLYFMGSMGAVFVPTPFLNGALSGTMLFMGTHELAQHPDSACMLGQCRPIATSRNWKHISAGAAISGIGCGLGSLALSTQFPALAVIGFLGGFGIGCKVAYSDLLFESDYRQVEPTQPITESNPPTVIEQSSTSG